MLVADPYCGHSLCKYWKIASKIITSERNLVMRLVANYMRNSRHVMTSAFTQRRWSQSYIWPTELQISAQPKNCKKRLWHDLTSNVAAMSSVSVSFSAEPKLKRSETIAISWAIYCHNYWGCRIDFCVVAPQKIDNWSYMRESQDKIPFVYFHSITNFKKLIMCDLGKEIDDE